MKQALADLIKGTDYLVERPKNVLQGTISGYPVCVRDGGTLWEVAVNARAGANLPAYTMDKLLEELRSANKKIKMASYDGKKVALAFKRTRSVASQIRMVLDRLVSYLTENGYTPCCVACGEDHPTTLSAINGRLDMLCDGCYNGIVGELESNRQNLAQKKGNMVTGLVGAFLGALLGGVLWVLIYQFGYIAGIAGLVSAVCALKGYEKFGGKVSVPGVVVCLVIVAVVIYFAHNIGFAYEIYKAFRNEVPITFFDAYRAIPDFLKEPQISSMYWKDLIVGYLLTAFASYATVRTMFQNGTGSYKTGRY